MLKPPLLVSGTQIIGTLQKNRKNLLVISSFCRAAASQKASLKTHQKVKNINDTKRTDKTLYNLSFANQILETLWWIVLAN